MDTVTLWTAAVIGSVDKSADLSQIATRLLNHAHELSICKIHGNNGHLPNTPSSSSEESS